MEVEINEEDWAVGRMLGATGCQVMEHAIHCALDREGVSREGRSVSVTYETIDITIPGGGPNPMAK